MENIVVDFETYYSKKESVSVVDQGVPNYVRDAYAYIVSIVGGGHKWCGTVEEARKKFNPSFWTDSNHRFWAAYSNFDYAWANRYFPETKNVDWHCLLDNGASEQLPHSLAGQIKVKFGRKIDKSVRDFMEGKHWDSLPDDEKKIVINYCLTDSTESLEVLKATKSLTPFEEAVAMQTRAICRRGLQVDEDLLEADREKLHRYQHNAYSAIPWVSEGVPPLSPLALKKWCLKEGIPAPISVDKRDPRCTALMSEYPKLNQVILNLRAFRGANTMIKKIETCLRRTTDEGILPLELMYCGARHTRRWSARGVNVQNLHRDPLILDPAGDPRDVKRALKNFEPHDNMVYPRFWITPRPGKIFLILDYAQIEPRCLNWLVGNEKMLGLIREGFSVYEAYARSVGAWSGNSSLKSGDPSLYHLIKAEVLGLGYGMGVDRHAAETNQSREAAQAQVYRFRDKNPGITKLWEDLDQLIDKTLRSRGDHTIEVGLPTGESLFHFDVRRFAKKYPDGNMKTVTESLTIQKERSIQSIQNRLWGGTLTENITQRFARDVMAYALLNLADAGFDIAFTAHDEVILEVDDDASKEESKQEAERIMALSPPWAEDLPLGVEGGFYKRYTKA